MRSSSYASKLPLQIQGNNRGPSPLPPRYDQTPHNEDHNYQPVNINIRNTLLDQCNNQYEENYKQMAYVNDGREGSKERSGYYPSPYAQERSVSPVREEREEDVEETIQGSIEGAMSAKQIKNKKAFVWAFGKNQEGELALGGYKDVLLPRFVTGLKGLTAKWISSSNHHTALIAQDGSLMVSGSSLHGKLGIEGLNKTNINKFQPVPALSRKKAKQVACGDYHTLCLMDDGTVYQFGGSTFKDKKDKIARPQQQQQNVPPYVPQPVQALYGKDIIQIDCGDFHSAALDANGDLYTWGGGAPSYNKGQCGHGHTNLTEQPEKVKYLSSKRIVQIACGGFHTLALTSENELYAFGSGTYGECGYGDFCDTSKPRLVKFPNDLVEDPNDQEPENQIHTDTQFVLGMYLKEQPMITQIAAGGRHSLVVTNKGRLYSFGYGTNGQLGLRNTSNYAKPQLVKDLIGKFVTQVAAGWNHSVIMTDRGDVYACGYGGQGQLGLGDKQSRTQFTFVESLGSKNISRLFAGGSHTWVVLDQIVPLREQWVMPSPLKQSTVDNNRSFSNTPVRQYDGLGAQSIKTAQVNSGTKPMGRNSTSVSPFQQKSSMNDQNKQFTMSSATFGGNQSFNKPDKTASSASLIPQGDDFIQKIIEIQQRQLMKAQFYLQITYCETEFCHRFINFEVHGQFIKQFETMLEEYIQQSYQQEKGVLYHKVQEVPKEFIGKSQTKITPGERLLREADGISATDSRDFSDLDDSFTPEEGHKAYTLCIISNPALNSYEELFIQWKQDNGITSKPKKIVVNSAHYQQQVKAVHNNDENMPLVGKIVFVKDSDIENNQFEEQMGLWMVNFHRKLAKYCIKKPRYSELRPMKFSLT